MSKPVGHNGSGGGLNREQLSALALDRHVSLTAGAGTGKTSVLVERYLAIIESAKARASGILALTFTEKAAAEMKSRVRRVAALRRSAAVDVNAAAFWDQALEDLLDPDIGTFHALCARLLREFPVEAGVDPSFKVEDESESAIRFDETVDSFLSELSDGNDERLSGISGMFNRRKLSAAFHALHAKRAPARTWAQHYAALSPADAAEDMKAGVERAAHEMIDLNYLASLHSSLTGNTCRDDSDKMSRWHAVALDVLGAALDGGAPDFRAAAAINLVGGKKDNWDDLDSLKAALGGLRDYAKKFAEMQYTAKDDAAAAATCTLASLYVELLEKVEASKGGGLLLDFDDLEEKALMLLEANPEISALLRRRYKFLLVDEFQDTNEIQWRIIRSLASPGGGRFDSNVFIVGDEKQSIYAFRGADVSMFGQARAELESANSGSGGGVRLSVCYRSHPALIEFFNRVFPIVFGGAAAAHFSSEISYGEIVAARVPLAEDYQRVEILLPTASADGGDDNASTMNRWQSEAVAVAARIKEMVNAGQEDGPSSPKLTPGDIAILFRTRTHLSEYQEALKAEGIPHTVSGGLGFFSCREVLDLVTITGFLAHPCDDMNLAAALRSPHIMLSDEDLLAISTMPGGYLHEKLRAAASHKDLPGHDRIAAAQQLLSSWLHAAGRMRTGELLRMICRDSGIFGIIGGGRAAKNIEKLFEMGDSFELRGGGSLAKFSDYIEDRIARDEMEAEAPGAGADADSVKLMTVHAAKGLEFPVVFIAGMSARTTREKSEEFIIESIGHGRVEAGFTVPDPESGFESKASAVRAIARTAAGSKHEEEQKRLLYVACTRAKEMLLLCGMGDDTFDPDGKPLPGINGTRWDCLIADAICASGAVDYTICRTETNASTAAAASRELSSHSPVGLTPSTGVSSIDYLRHIAPLSGDDTGHVFTVTDIAEFIRDRDAYSKARILGVPAEWERNMRPVDSTVKMSPLERGAIVHRIFEEWSPAMRASEDALIRRVLLEHGVTAPDAAREFESHYKQRLESFAASAPGRDLESGSPMREMPFLLKAGKYHVRGTIDVVYRSADAMNVLDYKTDRLDAKAIAEKDTLYRPQIEIYCLAVFRALGGESSVSGGTYYIEPSLPGERFILDRSNAMEIENSLVSALDEMLALRSKN